MPPLLEAEGLSRRFGGLAAVSDVSFSLAHNEILGVIGPNGAGKTTLLNLLSGALRPSAGRIAVAGRNATGWGFSRISRSGVVRTFQSATVFRGLSALDNIVRGTTLRSLASPLGLFAGFGEADRLREAATDTLRFVGLDPDGATAAGDLSYGHQKRLGLALGLVAASPVLLLDEPAAGLDPTETLAMTALVRRIRAERDASIMLVEHDVPMIMALCDRIMVLHHGKVLRIGTPAEVQSDPAVIDAYLGADLELA